MQIRAGFTLIEMLVAAAIFSVIIVITVNLFVLVLRGPLQQLDDYHLYEEMTYVFEQSAYHLHQTNIDYDRYSGTLTNPEDELYLLSLADPTAQYRLYLSAGQIYLDTTSGGVTTSLPLTSTPTTDVYIDQLQFYIYPRLDPFDPDNNINYQPAVVMSVSGHSVQNADVTFSLQTLITSRTYER